MIVLELWRLGLLRRLDREKFLFFFGFGRGEFLLSRRMPVVRSVKLWRAMLSPSYARAVAKWLRYRVELYDGLQG